MSQSSPAQVSPDGKFYWDGQAWVAVPQPAAPSLNASALPANQRGRLTFRQALWVILKETATGWVLVLRPADFMYQLVVALVPLAIILTPVFVIAAALECTLNLRSEEGGMQRTTARHLLFREYEIAVGQSTLRVPRRVHAGLVDGAFYRLYMTRMSRILVNYEKLDVAG